MGTLLVGWFVLSIAAALAFHVARNRYRPVAIPREVQDFLRGFETEVRSNHPQVEIRGMLPGRFAAVLAVRGQECPVSLHPLFRRWVAFPDTFAESVARFLEEVESDGLEQPGDYTFADVVGSVLPQVRSLDWLNSQGGVFGDGGLVHRAFTEDLVICYVIDEPWCMTFVCQAHLREWNRTEEDLYHIATNNLHRLAEAEVPVPESGEPVLMRTGDGFDATRVLLLDPDRVEGLLVALPERDVLWLGAEGEGENLASLMAQNEQQSQRSAHPVSPHLYRMTAGQLVPVTGADKTA